MILSVVTGNYLLCREISTSNLIVRAVADHNHLTFAICLHLVGRLKGQIGYELREGGGSVFFVELPAS